MVILFDSYHPHLGFLFGNDPFTYCEIFDYSIRIVSVDWKTTGTIELELTLFG